MRRCYLCGSIAWPWQRFGRLYVWQGSSRDVRYWHARCADLER